MAETTVNAIRSYHIQTLKKFPTITFEIAFLQQQKRVAMEARNLVAKVLPQVVAAFPSKIATKSYFANLYAARIYSGVQRRGDKHEVSFQFVFTDPQIVHDENYQMSDLITCIKRVLLEPQLEEGTFVPAVATLENTLMQARIANMEDDKMIYAQMQLLKHMFAGTPFASRPYGELANYAQLTTKEVYETYQKMLAEDTITISVVGNVDAAELERELAQMLTSVQQESVPLPETKLMLREAKDVQSFTEVQPVKQARLHIGYRIPATIHTPDYFVHQVATEILGGGSQSKLFQYVRERASLAYSISAAMDDFAEAMYIYAGVDRAKIDTAYTIIGEQVKAMQAGKITAEELQLAQENLLHRISMAQDSPLWLLRLPKQMIEFKHVSTLGAWKEVLQAISIDDVVTAAQRWYEDTVFILTDESTKKGEQ